MDVFKTLGNENRRSMLKIIMYKEMHISALAKELDISVPVALKHINILEDSGFVERTRIGNTHVVSINRNALSKIKSAYDLFEKPLVVSVDKGTSLAEALKKALKLSLRKTPEGSFISAIDGKPGYYIYEVDGKYSEKAVDQFLVNRSIEVEFKRLLPVVGKKIVVKVKN